MGSGKTISIQPRGDGGLTFHALSLYPEDWIQTIGIDFNDSEQAHAYLMKFYHDWNPVFFTLFKACLRFVIRPLSYMPLDQRWDTKDNITLIGDAAHLMPPNGESVNLAMLDALDLSIFLTKNKFKDLKPAISAFEDILVTRAGSLLEETVDGTDDFASPSTE
jgi:2-polyprenyl-6-methoxyphenol hydroxylase-like FAD-dependent oxidoreductase